MRFTLPTNESSHDRDIRIVLGITLAILAIFFTHGALMALLGLLSAVMFITAAIGFCPIYAVFGMNTCAPKEGAQSTESNG